MVSDLPEEEKYSTGNWIAEHPEGTRGNLSAVIHEIDSAGSQNSDNEDDRVDGDISVEKPGAPSRNDRARSEADPLGSRYQYEGARLAIRHIEPWYNSDFAPLPRTVLQGIRTANPSEMPVRHDYDKALWKFLTELPPELREVSAFAPDVYTGLAQAIEKGDTSTLSERIRSWVAHHHVRTGSRKYRLLLLPREQYFAIRSEREEKLRNEFITEVDGDVFLSKPSSSTSQGKQALREGTTAFIRVPVSPQIYDALVYAHKNHSSPSTTLTQIRQAGIVGHIHFASPSFENQVSSTGLHYMADDRVVPPSLPNMHFPIENRHTLSSLGFPLGINLSQLSSLIYRFPQAHVQYSEYHLFLTGYNTDRHVHFPSSGRYWPFVRVCPIANTDFRIRRIEYRFWFPEPSKSISSRKVVVRLS